MEGKGPVVVKGTESIEDTAAKTGITVTGCTLALLF